VQLPAETVRVATQIPANVGTYNYKVVATDSLTTLFNDLNTFTVTIQPPTLATDFLINAGTEIANQNYLVGSGPRILSVPTYTPVPANADLSISYAVNSAPAAAFITTVESPPGTWSVKIDTSNTAMTGIYTVDLTMTDAYSTLQRTTQFIVTVSCV